jgi:hypothetical protein
VCGAAALRSAYPFSRRIEPQRDGQVDAFGPSVTALGPTTTHLICARSEYDERMPDYAVLDLPRCAWSLEEESSPTGERCRTLLLTMPRPPPLQEEIEYKKGGCGCCNGGGAAATVGDLCAGRRVGCRAGVNWQSRGKRDPGPLGAGLSAGKIKRRGGLCVLTCAPTDCAARRCWQACARTTARLGAPRIAT